MSVPRQALLQQSRNGRLWKHINLTGSSPTTPKCNADRCTSAELSQEHFISTTLLRPKIWLRSLKRINRSFFSAFLPINFPQSVHKNYLPFSIWSFVQNAAGSVASVFSMQSLLFALGLSGCGSLPMAATLNWIMKDGLGQLGGIIFVSQFSHYFDVSPKKYRFFSSAILSLSCLLELLTALRPTAFLFIASIANAGKSVSWMAMSATRAQIHQHFALKDNMGDLSGKSGAQTTFASLIGTAIGVGICSTVLPASSSTLSPGFLAAFLPFSAISLWASYQSCLYVMTDRLDQQRFELIILPLLENIGSRWDSKMNSDELKRYILPPTAVSRRESFVRPYQSTGLLSHPKLCVEPAIDRFISELAKCDHLTWLEDQRYLIVNARDRLNVWFSAEANDHDRLRALWQLSLIRCRYYNGERDLSRLVKLTQEQCKETLPILESALMLGGWSLDQISFGGQRSIKLHYQHTNRAEN